MTDSFPHLHLDAQGPIAVLTIDRPAKRNALTPEMIQALGVLSLRAGQSATVLVLRGTASVFCSGFDLSLCAEHPDGSVMRSLLQSLSDLVTTLRQLPIPVIVCAHGAALAGGCAILGGADIVVTDERAKLGYPVVRIGVSPAVSAPFLMGMIQPGPARARLLDPGLISGVDALRLGLAHECVATPEDVFPRAMALASHVASKPRSAMPQTKAWALELDAFAGHAQIALEASLALAGTDEERELLARALSPPPTRPE